MYNVHYTKQQKLKMEVEPHRYFKLNLRYGFFSHTEAHGT